MYACRNGRWEVVKELIRAGASIDGLSVEYLNKEIDGKTIQEWYDYYMGLRWKTMLGEGINE